MHYTPNFSSTWKALLITLIGSSLVSPVIADLAIEWSYTVSADEFQIPEGYSHGGTRLKVVTPTPKDGGKTWMNTFWINGDGPTIQTVAIVNQEGDLLARKRMVAGENYVPWWIHDEAAILHRSFSRPGESPQDSTVVWRFDENKGISEEPFPFAGTIRGGNAAGAPGDGGSGDVAGLYTVQEAQRSATIRKIGWESANIAKATVTRKGAGIEVSTNTREGQSYRVQSSEDLQEWEDNERFIGDGTKQTVERAATKEKEFLRVIVE